MKEVIFFVSVGVKTLQKAGVAEIMMDSFGNAEGIIYCSCVCNATS